MEEPPATFVEVVALRSTAFISMACLVGCVPPAGEVKTELYSSEFEFVVVGSGAGGGPLAARLARAGRRVLLLEAGEDVGGKLKYQVPALHGHSTEDPAMAWWYFVQHHADPSIDRADSKHTPEGILYPRGSALGGSAAVNAMVTVVPSPWDWDQIAAETGDPSWRGVAMDRYYDRVREWLGVEVPEPELAMHDTKVSGFLAAAAATHAEDEPAEGGELIRLLSQDVNETLRHGDASGLFRLPLATKEGRRSSPREFILDTVDRSFPLTVETGAFVTKVILEGAPPRAVGVEYVRRAQVYQASLEPRPVPETRHRVFVTGEVILAAGTFNSPQLLMLSGVGEPAALEAHGIATTVAREGVGQNLQDRYEAAVVSEFETPVSVVESCELGMLSGDPCLEDWRRGEGVYRTSGFLATVLRRTFPEEPFANLQVFAVPGDARGYYPTYSNDSLARKNRFTWLLLQGHTQNQDGWVRLASADPFERPRINFNYFDEAAPEQDEDLLGMVNGVRFVRRIISEMQKTHPADPPREIWPGPAVESDRAIADFVRRETWGHHACCTNRMGRADDPSAVVDGRFRVIGVDGLRVVDSSVFPKIPGTFIAMPTYMISEKAADVILEDHR